MEGGKEKTHTFWFPKGMLLAKQGSNLEKIFTKYLMRIPTRAWSGHHIVRVHYKHSKWGLGHESEMMQEESEKKIESRYLKCGACVFGGYFLSVKGSTAYDLTSLMSIAVW